MASKNMKKLKRLSLAGRPIKEEDFPINYLKLANPDQYKSDGPYGFGWKGRSASNKKVTK